MTHMLRNFIRIFWKKRSYWQRGAILGFVYGIIAAILFILSWRFAMNIPLLNLILYFIIMPTYGIWFGLADGYEINETLALILTILIYSAIGAFIGFLIWKIKTAKSWLKKIRPYWKGPIIGFAWFLLNYITQFFRFMIVDFFSIDTLTSGGGYYWAKLIIDGTIGFPNTIAEKIATYFGWTDMYLANNVLMISIYILLGIALHSIYVFLKNKRASTKIIAISIILMLSPIVIYNLKSDYENRIKWPSDKIDESCRSYCVSLGFRSSYAQFNENANSYDCGCFTQYETEKAQAYFNEKGEKVNFLSIEGNLSKYYDFIIIKMAEDQLARKYSIKKRSIDENNEYLVELLNVNLAKRTASFKINNQIIENLEFNQEIKLEDGAAFGLIGLAETRTHYYLNRHSNREESLKVEFYIGK